MCLELFENAGKGKKRDRKRVKGIVKRILYYFVYDTQRFVLRFVFFFWLETFRRGDRFLPIRRARSPFCPPSFRIALRFSWWRAWAAGRLRRLRHARTPSFGCPWICPWRWCLHLTVAASGWTRGSRPASASETCASPPAWTFSLPRVPVALPCPSWVSGPTPACHL